MGDSTSNAELVICTHILLFNYDVYFIVKLGLNKLKPAIVATHAIKLHNYNLTMTIIEREANINNTFRST